MSAQIYLFLPRRGDPKAPSLPGVLGRWGSYPSPDYLHLPLAVGPLHVYVSSLLLSGLPPSCQASHPPKLFSLRPC